jgi:hypothetical protein
MISAMAKKAKKSQGMPLNVIIIAVLALIVLVILAAIFTGRVKLFSQGLESCGSKQGRCSMDMTPPGASCPSNAATVENTDCEKRTPKQVCCVTVVG